ncbi:MAG: HAMP domain-containing histidine kinase [Cyanobacteria bacterium]|nr:HAMP domain-containing histidine kinase [Cyanobacteriota bacterium]
MLGHELRNPLAPIRTATEILRLAGPENERQKWARQVLERQVRQLATLVDDLLDVTRIARGEIRLSLATVDLVEIIQDAVETSRSIMDGRRLYLDVAVADSIWVNGDRGRLVQVISNLLNNAAKFTDPGGRIELSATTRGTDAIIVVRDNGIGIEEDLLPTVFDLFKQGSRPQHSRNGGLGIGLTLARRLVELHHGAIQVYSAGRDRGSEFVVTLPTVVPPE